MNIKIDIIMQNKVFLWIVGVTALILMVPLVFTLLGSGVDGDGWHWTLSDFVIMAILLIGFGSLFVLTARKIQKGKNRFIIAIAFFIGLIWLWAELAVGIFTNRGS